MLFKTQYPHYEKLRQKWIAKNKDTSENLWNKFGQYLRHITLGSLGSIMLLATPGQAINLPQEANLNNFDNNLISSGEDKNKLLAEALKDQVPKEMRKLTLEEEKNISQIIAEKLRISVKSEIDGIRLNRSYGLIGGEQHLYRFPGDNLYKHFKTTSDWAMYGPAGIAPGLGAWGYFSSSEQEFNEKDFEQEKYYLAIQTFLVPGYAEDVKKYRDFFRFRKMVTVNPYTGQSVVAVIGDAGPAEWTGKHLGGSPEVMHYLGLANGPRKGSVLYFFVDDPEDKIPLGPILIDKI